jgi:ammonia channel protein AmtB
VTSLVLGTLAIVILSAVTAITIFALMKGAGILGVTDADEFDGVDLGEHDINGYPDFQQTAIKSYPLREA